jgi:nitroreductase
MNFDEALKTRRSVRAFLEREVPEQTIREIFELAQYTPSNCNVQPWVPHVVSGATLRRLRDSLVSAGAQGVPHNPDWTADRPYVGVYRARQVDAAQKLYGAMGVDRKDLVGRNAAYLRNLAFFDAPHAVLVFLPRPMDAREVTDLGMYAQTLMLAMTTRGVDSCAQGALGLYPDIVRRELGLDESHRLMFGISFGYEDPTVAANRCRVGRATVQESVVFHC